LKNLREKRKDVRWKIEDGRLKNGRLSEKMKDTFGKFEREELNGFLHCWDFKFSGISPFN